MAIVDESIRKYTGALGGTYFEGGVYYGADYACKLRLILGGESVQMEVDKC